MEKGTELFKKRLMEHLQGLAATDPVFAEKMANPNKSIDKCADYVICWVEKQHRCGFADEEIYGQAVHYYDETDVGEVSHSQCSVVIDETVELTEEEKAEAKKKAMERLIAQEMERMQKKSPAKKSVPNEVSQPTLF